MNVEDAATVLAREPCVLFLGSGVSIPSPSSLPSAARIVGLFLTAFAEGIVAPPIVDALLQRWPLPEYLYGTVERFFGPSVYEVWTALDLWSAYDGSFSPNAGHVAAVHASATGSTPVLTPNFDRYLESAAELLGVPSAVSVATPGTGFVPRRAAVGEAAIWKLHGTVDDTTTIFSSVRSLTSPVSGLATALGEALPPDVRLVLAGYSGRDLDLFPLISSVTRAVDPIWVDLSFSDEHRSRFLSPRAIQVVGSFDDVGRAYGRLVGGPVADAVRIFDERASRLTGSADAARLSAEIGAHIGSVAGAFRDVQRRTLVIAELLINAGLLRDADDLLAPLTMSGDLESERRRLRAKALWELGRFRTSREIAVEGKAARNASASAKDTLSFAVAAADLRMSVPPRQLPGTVSPSRAGLVIASAGWGWILVKGYLRFRRPRSIPEPGRTPFVEGYLEHTIRLLLGLQFATARSDGAVAAGWRALLVPAWRSVYRASVRVGYAEGIGNAGRYLARLGAEEPGGIRTAHEFLGHRLGMAITFRDAAQRSLKESKIAEAKARFDQGHRLAVEQGDPVLLLTFIPLARALGIPFDVPDSLVESVEAPWARDHLAWRSSGSDPTR